MAADKPDYYEILQVSRNAEAEVIEAAYRRLARKYHPDLNNDPRANERMRLLNEAFEVLGDRVKRAQYDGQRDWGEHAQQQQQRQEQSEPAQPTRTSHPTPKRPDYKGALRSALLVTIGLGLMAGVFALIGVRTSQGERSPTPGPYSGKPSPTQPPARVYVPLPPTPTATQTTANRPEAKLQGKVVKLAFIAPKTGPVADWGIEQEQVVKMAVKEINAAGGIGGVPLNIMFYDTQGKPDEAVSLTRKLYSEDKVLIVLGPHLSGEASVAFPIAVAMKAPIVSCCSAAPGVSAANRPWAFRLPQPDDKGLTAMIKKFVPDNKIQKAVVAGDIKDAASKVANTQYIPDALKAAGATTLTGTDPVGYNTGDTSFAAQATKIKDLNPDAIFMYGLPAEGGAFIKEIRRQGITKPIVTGSAFMATQFLQVGGDAVEGVVMNAVWDVEHPASKDFVANFRKAYNGKDPTMVGAYAYDSIYLMKQMIESTGVTNDPAQLAQDWQKLRDGIERAKFSGATGKTSFDVNGDGIHTVFEAAVKGGKFVINYTKILLDR